MHFIDPKLGNYTAAASKAEQNINCLIITDIQINIDSKQLKQVCKRQANGS